MSGYESAVICSIIRSPSKMNQVDLLPEHFQDENSRLIYSALEKLSKNNINIDLVTVTEELKAMTGMDWVKTIGGMMRDLGPLSDISIYVEGLKKEYKTYKVREVAYYILDCDGDCADPAVQMLMDLNKSKESHEYTLSECAKLAYEEAERNHNRDGIDGIRTGLSNLDERIGGLFNSNLIVLGGRPGMGKTAIMQNVMIHSKSKWGFISCEMSHLQVGKRWLSICGSVNADHLQRSVLNDYDWGCMAQGLNALRDKEIYINDQSKMTIHDVFRQARSWKYNFGIEALAIDYLQMLTPASKKMNTLEHLSECSLGVKSLAKELNIPVVVLAQVNREVDKRLEKRPLMSDLKGCGNIEQDADLILLAYRDYYYNKTENNKGQLEIIVAKNRHGGVGMVECFFNHTTMMIS